MNLTTNRGNANPDYRQNEKTGRCAAPKSSQSEAGFSNWRVVSVVRPHYPSGSIQNTTHENPVHVPFRSSASHGIPLTLTIVARAQRSNFPQYHFTTFAVTSSLGGTDGTEIHAGFYAPSATAAAWPPPWQANPVRLAVPPAPELKCGFSIRMVSQSIPRGICSSPTRTVQPFEKPRDRRSHHGDRWCVRFGQRRRSWLCRPIPPPPTPPPGHRRRHERKYLLADTENHPIRKINPAGMVTTLAGGSDQICQHGGSRRKSLRLRSHQDP